MADRPSKSQKTDYPGVYTRGDVVFYRYRPVPGGKVKTVSLRNVSPKEAWLERERVLERCAKIRSGEIDPQAEKVREHSRKSITDHIEAYQKHLEAKGNDPEHTAATISHITRWAQGCDIETMSGADPEGWYNWTIEQRTKQGKPWSARYRNASRQAIAGFYRWAVTRNRLGYNPMARELMTVADAKHAKENESRTLTPEEFWDRLIPAVTLDRQIVYMLKALLGLRGREIPRIERRDIDLDTGVLVVLPTTGRKASKGRESAETVELPMPAALVDKLRELIDQTGWKRGPIPVTDPTRIHWLKDLVRAGLIRLDQDRIDAINAEAKKRKRPQDKVTDNRRFAREYLIGYEDEDGRVLDRKCLRRTYGTWLMHAGVDLREAQRLMRHSSPELTANVYTGHGIPRLRQAVESVAGLGAHSQRTADASQRTEIPRDAQGRTGHAAG